MTSDADKIFDEIYKRYTTPERKELILKVGEKSLELWEENQLSCDDICTLCANMMCFVVRKTVDEEKANFLQQTLQKFFEILAKNSIEKFKEEIENELRNR